MAVSLALACLWRGAAHALPGSRTLLQAGVAGGVVANEGPGVYTTTTPTRITLANATLPATQRTNLAIAAVSGTGNPQGVWASSSLNSGVIVIHASVTSNNYALFMERPGNRENAVRMCRVLPHLQILAAVSSASERRHTSWLFQTLAPAVVLTGTWRAAQRGGHLQPVRQQLPVPAIPRQPVLFRPHYHSERSGPGCWWGQRGVEQRLCGRKVQRARHHRWP